VVGGRGRGSRVVKPSEKDQPDKVSVTTADIRRYDMRRLQSRSALRTFRGIRRRRPIRELREGKARLHSYRKKRETIETHRSVELKRFDCRRPRKCAY